VAAPAAPPAFTVVGAILLPGRKPALTMRVGGDLRTVSEGDTLEGYRVERIERDRVILAHIGSGARSEHAYGDTVASVPSSPVVASAPSAAGPFVPSPSAPPPVAAAPPANVALPSANYVPPRAPPGATVKRQPARRRDHPHHAGPAPPGMSGPRPVPLRPARRRRPAPWHCRFRRNAQGPTTR
jgi:hypothetical protein